MMDNFADLLMDERPPDLQSPDDNQKHNISMNKNVTITTKGVASSFGFKRRPLTAPSALTTSNQVVARRLAFTDSTDSNGNDQDTKPLTAHFQTNGRSTPRLPPPKKEGSATQGVGRFGFRQTNLQVNRSNRVADLNAEYLELSAPRGSSTPRTFLSSNNAASQNRYSTRGAVNKTSTISVDKNRNRTATVKTPTQTDQIGRFTLQTNQLPKPQPVRVMDTKTAKTIANNNMKFSSSGFRRASPVESLKDGSLTEDSGLGSHVGTDFDSTSPQTPTAGKIKHRNLEVMVNGNTFELREPDMEDVPLPKLPSAVCRETPERSVFQSTGMVRERTFAYEQQIEKEIKRKISATSSEGFSDGSCQKEENTQHKPLLLTQKSFLKPKPSPIKTFLKTKVIENKEFSSGSSEDIEFGLGGEALADELSVSISSSDESKDRDMNKQESKGFGNVRFPLTEDKSFLKKSLETLPLKQEFRPVTLTIADSTLEAAAAESISERLLDDETSPVDDSLLSFTESEDGSKTKKHNSSDSKDINEKPSPSTPGTPSNGSNSFSLIDEKDFLIDDEYADQPELLGDKSQRSESTVIGTSTPIKRRQLKNLDSNPLFVKDKGNLRSSTISLDTLSPCESIGSDDLMMDFEYSHSSLDEDKWGKKISERAITFEERNSVNSLETDIKNNEHLRDWTALLNGTNDKNIRSGSSRPRFLRSRTGTPNSICDSPSSLDGRSNGRHSTPSGSLRRFVHTSSQGYESDDSIVRLDRTTQAAIKNDISAVKTMLFKLRGILNEQTIDDALLKSETRNPFEEQMNGQNNGLVSEQNGFPEEAEEDSGKLELIDLKRQILFLQGQLEDKEKKVMSLENQLTKMCTDNYLSNSAPASTTSMSREMSNAATQTDRIRRLSTEPSLTNCSQLEATQGNLVRSSGVTETPSRNRPSTQKTTPPKEASVSPMYQRNTKAHTMIPRRSESRSRATPSSLS
ncbi:uncharacterized protein LOC123315003 isoform X3 [Coccinella septempunctata]|uniref:uncharacterized protein LOC123315003 isoform X3 n=1 Tax=Coccinella septempunctata TaxID=41139 RepID=UPI001D08D452|nr:uncharacterized protein LOC123315003 isoform X3 [Coccinella septempunctata]